MDHKTHHGPSIATWHNFLSSEEGMSVIDIVFKAMLLVPWLWYLLCSQFVPVYPAGQSQRY